jgi:hypothetical protein
VVGPAVLQRPVALNGVATYDRQTSGQQRRTVTSLLRRPPVLTVAAPSVVFAPVKTTLVRQPQQFRRTLSALRAPATLVQAVIGFLAPPRLARPTRTPQAALRTLWRLRPPVVVAPAVTQRPVMAKTAATPRRLFRTRSFYTALPPVAGLATPTLDQTRVRVKITAQPARKPATWALRRPVVVAYPVLPEQRRLKVALVPSPKQGRNAHAILRLPTVVDPSLIAVTTTAFFRHPDPSAAGLLGTPAAGTFRGKPDDGGLVGAPGGNQFRPPRPGTT